VIELFLFLLGFGLGEPGNTLKSQNEKMEQKNASYGLGMTVFGSIFFIFGFASTF